MRDHCRAGAGARRRGDGRSDIVCGVPHAEAIAAAVPNAMVRVFPDCGHMPQYERPDAFTMAGFERWDEADARAG